jgi:hypothetical protein
MKKIILVIILSLIVLLFSCKTSKKVNCEAYSYNLKWEKEIKIQEIDTINTNI